ncbi:argininosuccinate lyase [uncultured Roseovarius sp.]|uniref:argininosuccinate lyase n=1 Tax=uncultured Roseovarius sp. TaxID=293344 RepID=UPI0025E9D093|nr:argininosuccinate lyase [uncultured Roseovarius sp.]
MIRILAVLSLAAQAACGVDGEPIRPSMNTTVGVGSGGVSASTGATWVTGRTSVTVGTAL